MAATPAGARTTMTDQGAAERAATKVMTKISIATTAMTDSSRSTATCNSISLVIVAKAEIEMTDTAPVPPPATTKTKQKNFK